MSRISRREALGYLAEAAVVVSGTALVSAGAAATLSAAINKVPEGFENALNTDQLTKKIDQDLRVLTARYGLTVSFIPPDELDEMRQIEGVALTLSEQSQMLG